MTFKTAYPELDVVLQKFVSGVQQILRDNLIGVYLQGSFAVGDCDEHSDCDFAVAINQELSAAQLRDLQSMHRQIFNLNLEWAKHLEGSYFPLEILWDYNKSGLELWYLDNGHSVLEKSNHCNNIIVRWILREKGVVLSGPAPATLIEPISVEVLQRAILTSINETGRLILTNPEQYNNRFYQGFIVLQFCRKLHNHYTGAIGSKLRGAEWAKLHLDHSWSGLIDRAWNGRPNPAVSVRQPANQADFNSTLEFVKVVMNAAREFAANQYHRKEGVG